MIRSLATALFIIAVLVGVVHFFDRPGQAIPEIPPNVIQQVTGDAATTQSTWTQPSAVYTVTVPNHPGAPCVLNPECNTQPDQPSQISIFTHAGDPREDANYGRDYCAQEMVEQAPGTTCTVRPDPLTD